MSGEPDPKNSPPGNPSQEAASTTRPVGAPHPSPVIDARRTEGVWTADQLDQLELRDGQPSPRRSFASKMFGVSPWGWIKLAALCLVVGVVLRIANVDPFEPGFTLGGAVASLGRGIGNLLLWALANGWAPALIGVIVVMPIWLLWRLLSVPFRR